MLRDCRTLAPNYPEEVLHCYSSRQWHVKKHALPWVKGDRPNLDQPHETTVSRQLLAEKFIVFGLGNDFDVLIFEFTDIRNIY